MTIGEASEVTGAAPLTPDAQRFSLELRQTIRAGGDWCGVLMTEISRVLYEGGEWCSNVKAQTLATLIVGLRPALVCEVGVWLGGSMIPMLLALRAVEEIEIATRGSADRHRAVAIDAWSAEASCAGQTPANAAWWSAQSHDGAHDAFLARLARHDLARICQVVRAPSDAATVPAAIGILHLDGNHGEQAVRDVERFGSQVEIGGILVLDDLDWSGGHVVRARDRATQMGFQSLFPLGTGVVLQRVSRSAI